MPRVRMTRGVVGEDRTDWLPGTEHDASPAFARSLVQRNAAVLVTGALPPVPPLTSDHLTIQNRAASPESRDPRPKGKRR